MADSVVLLSNGETSATELLEEAKDAGLNASTVAFWHGPEPDGSFFQTDVPGVRMSTPEFYFLRMANQLFGDEAVLTGSELLSCVATHRTSPNIERGKYELRRTPHTTPEKVLAYLLQINNTREALMASLVFALASESVEEYETYIKENYTRV